jgi:hypothetical protein
LLAGYGDVGGVEGIEEVLKLRRGFGPCRRDSGGSWT